MTAEPTPMPIVFIGVEGGVADWDVIGEVDVRIIDWDEAEENPDYAANKLVEFLSDDLSTRQLTEWSIKSLVESVLAGQGEFPYEGRTPTGTRLPNGATLVHETTTGDQVVVLAFTDGKEPWVTWRHLAGHPEGTGAGHYFSEVTDAVRDYVKRGGM